MPRRSTRTTAAAPDPEEPSTGAPDASAPDPHGGDDGSQARRVDLSELPVLGLSRRRIGYALGVVVAVWVVIVFARQVSEASAATARAEALRTSNEQLAAHVESLEDELELIKRQEFIVQQARAHRLGAGREIPFALADDAPSLPPDAPGSASVRLGAVTERAAPIETWLSLLFGPGD